MCRHDNDLMCRHDNDLICRHDNDLMCRHDNDLMCRHGLIRIFVLLYCKKYGTFSDNYKTQLKILYDYFNERHKLEVISN